MKKVTTKHAIPAIRVAGLLAGAALLLLLIFGFYSRQQPAEKLLGISFNYLKKEVTLQVVTTGCTVKNDFEFRVSGQTITIVRKKRDDCKMMPEMVSFTYTFAETGISAGKVYTIVNGFIANPDLANIP